MTLRSFIAVEVECFHGVKAVMDRIRGEGLPVRLVNPGNIHLTLRFLGDIREDQVGPISKAMEAAVEGVGRFTLSVRGLGAFPRPSNPKVLWLGVKGADPLFHISKRLLDGLSGLGLTPDRKGFKPHVTIGRVKRPGHGPRFRTLVEEHHDTAFGEQPVEDILLKKSLLTPQGPIYSTLYSAPLDADPDG